MQAIAKLNNRKKGAKRQSQSEKGVAITNKIDFNQKVHLPNL